MIQLKGYVYCSAAQSYQIDSITSKKISSWVMGYSQAVKRCRVSPFWKKNCYIFFLATFSSPFGSCQRNLFQ